MTVLQQPSQETLGSSLQEAVCASLQQLMLCRHVSSAQWVCHRLRALGATASHAYVSSCVACLCGLASPHARQPLAGLHMKGSAWSRMLL